MPLTDWFRRKPETEERHITSNNHVGLFGLPSTAGVRIDETSALQLSTVYACVRIISESIASLPVHVHRMTPQGVRNANELPLTNVLGQQVNPDLTAFMFFELMVSHACLYGNAYAIIERNARGQVTGLVPVEPAYVQVNITESGKVAYRITSDQADMALPSSDVLHIRGLGPNGLKGYSPIALAREAIGLGLASERYGAAYFGNAAMPSGVLSVPGKLSDEAFNNLRQSWENLHRGASNSARVALLEGGIEFKPLSLPPNESQFLQTRKFQTLEIARMFRVPPTLLAELEGSSSYGSIYELNRGFVTHTLTPWARRIENELESKLLSSADYKITFHFEEMLRGDLESRYRAYQLARQAGFMSINDIRKAEQFDPIGANGDDYLSPLNMERLRPGSDQPDERSLEVRAYNASKRKQALDGFRPTMRESLSEMVELEIDAVQQYQENGTGDIADWAERYFSSEYQRQLFSIILPAIRVFSEQLRETAMSEVGEVDSIKDEVLRNIADRFTIRRSVRARSNLRAEDTAKVLEIWREEKTDTILDSEIRRLEGALMLEYYRNAGVKEVQWVGGPGQKWPSLDGKKVPTGEPFVLRGEVVVADDGEEYEARTDIRHTPLNSNDNSTIKAVINGD